MSVNTAYFLITTEDNFRAWVRADEVGTFYETAVHGKRGPGRPANGGGPPKPVPVIALTLRHGKELFARGETLDSIASKLTQALGKLPFFIEYASTEDGSAPHVPRANGHVNPDRDEARDAA